MVWRPHKTIFKLIDPSTIHADPFVVVGHSSQKLLPESDFWIFPHLYPLLNYKRLGVDRLWVYKFENRFVGSPYHPSSAPKRPKQNSNFCFFWHRLLCMQFNNKILEPSFPASAASFCGKCCRNEAISRASSRTMIKIFGLFRYHA